MNEGGPYLAMEVSSPLGSVAVGRWRSPMVRGFLADPREHAGRLVPAVASVLAEAGLEGPDLRGLVVGRGPGSFTGVRVGAATARGLAAALRIPVWTYSSLAAAAMSDVALLPTSGPDGDPFGSSEPLACADAGRPRCVLFDARGDRLYAACYRWTGSAVEALDRPRATTIDALLETPLPEGVMLCGDGARRHQARLEAEGLRVLAPPLGTPTAEGLLRLHALHPGSSPEAPGSRWEPDYLRGSWGGPLVESGVMR